MMFATNTPPAPPSIGWHSPYSPKTLVREEKPAIKPCDPHNNTVNISVSVAQIDAYSPGEDRIYVNQKDNLFAIFDGHGGGILKRIFYFFSRSSY
jgi:hypothetical protein